VHNWTVVVRNSICLYRVQVPIIAHEIGHSIGFWHEQSRPDRDSYVNIFSNNIKNGKAHNFVKRSWNTVKTYGIPYDYSSIMHYGIYVFPNYSRLQIACFNTFVHTKFSQTSDINGRWFKTINDEKWSLHCNIISVEIVIWFRWPAIYLKLVTK
jgi:hypothetical protein